MENSENKMEGLPKEPQVSQPTPDQNLTNEVVPTEVLADETKAQPDTPESPAEEKEREAQSQELDNPSTILRRDLRRIKTSVDDSFNRLGKKLNDLLNFDGNDQNE